MNGSISIYKVKIVAKLLHELIVVVKKHMDKENRYILDRLYECQDYLIVKYPAAEDCFL